MSYLGLGINGQSPAIEIHEYEKGAADILESIIPFHVIRNSFFFLESSYFIYWRRESGIICRVFLSQIGLHLVPSCFVP
jgi:hypothetical protein